MTMKQYDPPAFIEELTFWVRPDLLDKYIELDRTLWVEALSTQPGFLGSQVWLGEDGTGEITILYHWRSYEDYTGLEERWLAGLKEKTGAQMGEGAMRFIGAMEKSRRKFLVREYTR